jgi:hypothetical protein
MTIDGIRVQAIAQLAVRGLEVVEGA